MTPHDPAIYHITHVDNLPGIVAEGGLWCDAQRLARSIENRNIGHLHIKKRRLSSPVKTSGGGNLGDYVPFNFCARSVMLFAVSKRHQDYDGTQEGILHLVSSVSTATKLGRGWAFTDRHAELGHALHFNDLDQLGEVPWTVMNEKYWTGVKEERQAEFLVYEFFPWTAITKIGTMTPAAEAKTIQALAKSTHKPMIAIERDWYY